MPVQVNTTLNHISLWKFNICNIYLQTDSFLLRVNWTVELHFLPPFLFNKSIYLKMSTNKSK